MLELRTPHEVADWLRQRVTGQLQTDSRLVRPGDGFLAWSGASADGRLFVSLARAQGAAACIVEKQGVEDLDLGDSPDIACYDHLKAHAGWIANAFYASPSEDLELIAVTGTNGKTSTTWWLAQALNHLKGPDACAVIGTLGTGVVSALASTGMTTPDAVLLQSQLRAFADQQVRYVAMEASSIGIEEHRLDGTQVRVAVFTNLTQDHLDYHGDMTAYGQAKARLFVWAGLQSCVINIEDPFGAELAQSLQHKCLDIWTCSRWGGQGRLQARQVMSVHAGLTLEIAEGAQSESLQTAVIGDFNIDNLLGVIAVLRAVGYDLKSAVAACAQLSPVPGRMQMIPVAGPNLPMAVVDYAHTPDAVAKALQALKNVAAQRQGQLWCVMGCGGDRDASKRPLMTRAAEQVADQVVLTSDNPRSEDPVHILEQMSLGMRSPLDARVIVDRALAIEKILSEAGPFDVVLIAGKGHEDYQDIAGVRHPFSDIEHAQRVLQRLAAQSNEELQ
jgi:UDP-N-acetylmuramoyl-L-alanyl-D-glutamate--2,6-diaminopimelate ligase